MEMDTGTSLQDVRVSVIRKLGIQANNHVISDRKSSMHFRIGLGRFDGSLDAALGSVGPCELLAVLLPRVGVGRYNQCKCKLMRVECK